MCPRQGPLQGWTWYPVPEIPRCQITSFSGQPPSATQGCRPTSESTPMPFESLWCELVPDAEIPVWLLKILPILLSLTLLPQG